MTNALSARPLIWLRSRIKRSRALRAGIFLAENAVRGLRSPSVPPPDDAAPRYRLAAMIRVKDEARFLPEWLAHHIGLGVEHVVVYDNNSSDGTRDAVEPFIENGWVTYVPWPTVPASPSSHLDFLARFGPSCRWVAFLDADEFLVEATRGALAASLDAAGDAPALAVNWRYFGGAGHETVPAGLVTELFDRADRGPNDHVKVIAHPAEIVAYRNSHNFFYRRGRLARTPGGRRVFGSFVTPREPSAVVINHYVYRSRKDYERKAQRGFVDASGAQEQMRRAERAEQEFYRHNDVVVTMSEPTLARTADLLKRLGYPEALHRATARGGTRARGVAG